MHSRIGPQLEQIHWRCVHHSIDTSFGLVRLDEWPKLNFKLGFDHIGPGLILDWGGSVLALVYKLFVVSLHIQAIVGVNNPDSLVSKLCEVADISVKLLLGRNGAISPAFFNFLPWDRLNTLFDHVVEKQRGLFFVILLARLNLFHQ